MKGAAVAALLLAPQLACSHAEPFGFDVPPADSALAPGPVARMTFNAGDDVDPAWLDSTALLYTAERLDRADRDRCVVMLPARGGTMAPWLCPETLDSRDTLDVIEAVAPARTGALAYVWTRFDLFPLTPFRERHLVVATRGTPFTARARVRLPIRAAGGFVPHFGAQDIRWLGPDELVYRSVTPHYPQPCKACRRDAVTPLEIVHGLVDADTLILTAIPGTLFSTSLALIPPDTLLYTVMGDSLLYRRVLGAATSDVVADFGPEIVRGVQVVGNRIVVIVGGLVAVVIIPTIGIVQNDDGGRVVLVDRATGARVTLLAGRLYRHPALAADGRRLLAEARTGATWDVWALDLP